MATTTAVDAAKVKVEQQPPAPMDADDDDDEEDDGDYKPEEDPEAAVGDDDDEEMQDDDDDRNDSGSKLDYHKRKGVDAAFLRLFGYEWGTEFVLDEESLKDHKYIRELVRIFGPTKAARILGSPAPEGYINPRKRRKLTNKDDVNDDETPIVVPMSKPEMITETKIFAGQAIQVQRKVSEKDNNKNAASKVASKAPSSNIDNVLAQLSGPTKLSTTQKTSNDWEQFKSTDKQLQEELERKAQSKDAYLVKQDFLNRVDQRKFNIEKEERDRERSKRGK